jgi:hypothetical protein
VLSGKKAAPKTTLFIAACKHLLRVKLFLADQVIGEVNKSRKKVAEGP